MKSLFTKNLIVILFTALVIRILFAFSYDTADTGAFCNAGKLFLLKQEVYADPNVYFSGPPFALHVTAAMQWFGNRLQLPCQGMWKMPSVVTDIGIGFLIYLIAKNELKKSTQVATHMALLYVYNPISIFVSSFQGQQESFWLFLVLLGWFVLRRYEKVGLSAFCIGIAFAYKIPVILLLPGFIFLIKSWKDRVFFMSVVLVIFAVSLLPEIVTSPKALIKQSFLYSSSIGIWGFSGLFKKVLEVGPVSLSQLGIKLVSILSKIVLVIGFIKIYWSYALTKKKNFFELSLNILLYFLVFTPGFGTQYLQWLLPFFILTLSPYFFVYSILVTFAYLHTYGLGFPPFDLVMGILQRNLYYKLAIMYPYDLYYPVWMFLFIVLFKSQRLPKWLQKITVEY